MADILIKGDAPLRGTTIEGDIIPRLIDEIPVLAVAAAAAKGRTVIKDAAELRVKESDRITLLAQELSKLGVQVAERADGLEIEGGHPLKGDTCFSHGDHRLAMSLAIAGLMAQGTTIINASECIDVSFPGFADLLDKIKQHNR